MRFIMISVMLCFVMAFAGCSGHKQVKGKVTLTDGTPIGRGHVVFEKEGFSANGEIKEDGSYVMGSLKANDGLPPGEYTVYITGATKVGKNVSFQTLGGGGQMQTVSIPSLTPIIAKKYTSAQTSDLRCKVEKSMTFDISVEPYGL